LELVVSLDIRNDKLPVFSNATEKVLSSGEQHA